MYCVYVLQICKAIVILIYMHNMIFEWDENKEQLNIKKHGLDFSTAARVFYDVNRIEVYDDVHSIYEDRYRTIGTINGHLTIVTVSYTMRENETVIRLISARLAEPLEKEVYYNGIDQKNY